MKLWAAVKQSLQVIQPSLVRKTLIVWEYLEKVFLKKWRKEWKISFPPWAETEAVLKVLGGEKAISNKLKNANLISVTLTLNFKKGPKE